MELHCSKFFSNAPGLLQSSFLVFLGMDCLEHSSNIFPVFSRYNGKDVAEKMHAAPLVFRFRKNLRYGVTHGLALVTNHQLDTFQSAVAQEEQKGFPAFLVFLHTFGRADDFAVTVLVDRNSNKDSYA